MKQYAESYMLSTYFSKFLKSNSKSNEKDITIEMNNIMI